ncbi:MAG: hypothetical protein JXD23_11085, partial [Spirochaetales bacterium]|nr:hypothetical protein [Spirochaetales bacterium]
MKKALFAPFAALIVMLLAGPAPGHAAPPEQSLHSNYDHDLLEVYFKRAENVRDEAEWREMVDQGIDVVKGRWESAALLAAGDPDLVAEERALLDGELETEKNERLTSFLLDKFFRQLSGAEIESVLQAVEEANKLYLYQKDEEGNIKIDAAGDPMLYERVNCDTGAEFEEDDAAWRDAVAARIARVASAWDANAESIWDALPVDHPELLAALGGESGRFSLSLAACRQGLVNEFERIRTQEERIFREKRLSDQYSLRKKTDEEAAAETADRLIAEAREEGEAGIRRVRDGLERLDLRISVGNVDVSSRDWLSSFEREFDKGLDVWESAEREFLRRRSEWEKEAGIRFEAAEKEWAGAYRRLLDARAAWEAGLMREKERGLRLWREKEDKLAVSLREASEKLEQAIGERTGGVGMQISALFDMYLQADTVLVTADNSIEFWRDDLSDLIAEYNDSETAKTEGRIDPARLEEAFRNRDTAALTALAGELAAKLTAVQAAVRERKTEFDEALCPLLSRYDDAHRDDPHQTLTVSFPYGDERFMNYVNSSGGGGWNLSEEKCRAYFAQHIESFLTIDGQSILTVIDRMADFNDPRLKDDADGSRTDITLTCSFRMQGGSEFHFDTIVHCWTEEWRAAASQYLAGEIEHFGDRAADALNAAQELSFWFEQQATYQTYRQQAAQSLADTYGLALGDADAAERDAVNGDWSSLLLDCFQRELLIAKGESAYWQKQVTIARAVADYAHDTSSGRPTEAETQARYDAALAEFTQAETDYQAAVAELTRLGEDVATTRAEYEQAKAVWDRARTALEQKQAVYQQKMGVLMNMGDEYYRNGIQARYDELLVDFGLKSRENTPTLAGTMADYYAALARYGGEQRAAAGARELSALVNGSAQAGLPSLDDLKRRVSDYGAILTYDQTTGAAHIDESRMAAGAPGLDDLTAATAAYNLLLGDSDADPADLRMARLTLDGMAASLAGGATEAYRNRIEAMSLLAAGSYAQWTAAAETGLSPDEMRTQAESSGIVYLRDKALLLGSVFDKIASGVYTKVVLAGKDDLSGEERLALACLLAFDGDEVDALRESLAKIARIFPSSSPGPLDSYRDAITSLTSMDEAARAFFASGGNIFGGVDFADLFAPQSARDRDRALTRAALLDRYAGLAQCLSADAGARAVDGLAEYLSANGLGGRSDAGFALSNPESVWRAAVAGGPADRRTVLSALKRYQDGLAEIGPGLPAWMYEGVAGYLDRLADYFTLKLVMAEKPADTNDLAVVTEWHREQKTKLDAESAALKTGQAAFDRRTADLRAFESALADRNLAPLSKLVSIYKALGGCGEAILEDDAADLLVRHSLSAAEAREELVNLAAVTLASRAYGQNGSDPETVLASSADLGLGDLLSRDAALKTSILERAASLLAGARSLDQSLDSLDFTGASGPEARYALWRRCAPEEVRAEVSGADADAIRAELAAESQDLEKLRLMLSLGSLEAVAGIKGEGKTYSRALYLGLADAGFDGAELASAWTLLCDAYGIADRDTAAFLGAFAAGGADETGQALFCYEGSQYGKAYYLKGLVLSGESAYPYLDDSVRADIEEFQRQLDLLKNYLPGIDGDKFDYAAPAGGNALAAGKAGALLELGIDDPFFAQFEGSTGGAWLDFLSIHAEGAARNVSELMLERGTIEDRANADAAKDHARTLAHVTRERDLIARWLSADETAVTRGGLEYTAKYGFNFRSALEADKLAVDNGDPLPALDTEALAEDASSPGGLYYY